MNHLIPYALQWGRGSVGHFALASSDRLIIFIHGFGGEAIDTWKGMDSILASSAAASSDVVFYGYGSLGSPAQISATLFRKFLEAAVPSEQAWQDTMKRAGADAKSHAYSDIVIVAHSLGAVVARRALLDSIQTKASWLGKVRLLLFGPAHKGTRLLELRRMLKGGVSTILSDFFVFAQVKMPVLDDLEKDSDFLQALESDSNDAIATGVTAPVIAQYVVFGERENVVHTLRFCGDPLSDAFMGADHKSVCKVPDAAAVVISHL